MNASEGVAFRVQYNQPNWQMFHNTYLAKFFRLYIVEAPGVGDGGSVERHSRIILGWAR